MGDEDTEYFSDGEDEPKSRASCTAATEIIGPVSTSSELNSPGGGVDGGGVDGLTKASGFWRVSYNTFNMKQEEKKNQAYIPSLVPFVHRTSGFARAGLRL
jgi:hypothetical protein